MFLDIVNVVVLVAFAVDYVVEARLSRPTLSFIRSEWTSLVIVLAQTLALLPGLAGVGVFRVLRAGRVWRFLAVVAWLAAIGGAVAADGKQTLRRHRPASPSEPPASPGSAPPSASPWPRTRTNGRLHSFFDALWWSSTITTVGYGDVYPVTAAGRIIGVFTMVVGISTFAIVTAKVAEFLVRARQAEAVADPVKDEA